MSTRLQKANLDDISTIWKILQQAIAKRKAEGSTQWQDGYPNLSTVKNDVTRGVGYVLKDKETTVGYVAILINDEPEYNNLKGTWLSYNDFVVFHRVAIAQDYLGQGFAQQMMKLIENHALKKEIYSIKADTNFDNHAMLSIFDKMGYSYCGQVTFRNSPRRAYEKLL